MTKPMVRSEFGLSSDEALIVLNNCTNFKQLRQIHGKLIRSKTETDQILVRKLIQLSASYGQIRYGALVFHHTPQPNTFTWNLMMRSFTSTGFPDRALLLFPQMLSQSVAPDKFTFPFLINACATSSALPSGQVIHGLAVKSGFSGDTYVQNTLMDFYFKCDHPISAHRVFDKMRVRNVVSWTTMVRGLVDSNDLSTARLIFDQIPTKNVVSWSVMIDGYVRNHQFEEAFKLFSRMQTANVRPNEFTLVSLLRACTELGSLELGKWIHDFTLANGFEIDVFLGTALVDMYSKCGSLSGARKVFDEMPSKSLATWNSMITSLGVHGFGYEALSLFSEMEEKNVKPDAITFVGVLCACLKTNNLDDASFYFERMTEHYGISPIEEHLICMDELYSRADVSSEVALPE